MNRIEPGYIFEKVPCALTAVSCAKGESVAVPIRRYDGWMTIPEANRFIRDNLNVRKYQYFKRDHRVSLKKLHLTERAIVLVTGHYIYANKEDYYSFFENEDDDVVAVWYLKD